MRTFEITRAGVVFSYLGGGLDFMMQAAGAYRSGGREWTIEPGPRAHALLAALTEEHGFEAA